MAGQTDLQAVLKSMQISCDDVRYGFATLPPGSRLDFSKAIGTFQEAEGLTVISEVSYLKDNSIAYEGEYAKLTIEVHTSLELVGLTAALATKLGENGISANVVAAYFHDHIFVQYDVRQDAIDALLALKD